MARKMNHQFRIPQDGETRRGLMLDLERWAIGFLCLFNLLRVSPSNCSQAVVLALVGLCLYCRSSKPGIFHAGLLSPNLILPIFHCRDTAEFGFLANG